MKPKPFMVISIWLDFSRFVFLWLYLSCLDSSLFFLFFSFCCLRSSYRGIHDTVIFLHLSALFVASSCFSFELVCMCLVMIITIVFRSNSFIVKRKQTNVIHLKNRRTTSERKKIILDSFIIILVFRFLLYVRCGCHCHFHGNEKEKPHKYNRNSLKSNKIRKANGKKYPYSILYMKKGKENWVDISNVRCAEHTSSSFFICVVDVSIPKYTHNQTHERMTTMLLR